MYKILYIEDKVAEVEGNIKQLIDEKVIGQPSNFSIDVQAPIEFEKMGTSIFDKLIISSSYDALILDWNLSEEANEQGNRVVYRAAELGQYIRREVAEKELGQLCFPIFVLSAQKYISTLYIKDKASHDIFDRVYSKEDFFLRKNVNKTVNEINLFIDAYKILQQFYTDNPALSRDDYPLKEILPHLLSVESGDIREIIDFNELIVPHPYGYIKFIYNEMIMRSGALVGLDVLCARLGIQKEYASAVTDKLDSAKYSGIMSQGYERWWMHRVNNWWSEHISTDPLVFLDAEDRVSLINQKLDLSIKPATAAEEGYSSFFWHVSKHNGLPIDESDAIRIHGSKRFAWQDFEYISVQDYIDGVYEKQIGETFDQAEIQTKLG